MSQRRKLTSVQLSFSTVPQRYDSVNNDVVRRLLQRRCASWDLTQAFSCQFCEISKKTLFVEKTLDNRLSWKQGNLRTASERFSENPIHMFSSMLKISFLLFYYVDPSVIIIIFLLFTLFTVDYSF